MTCRSPALQSRQRRSGQVYPRKDQRDARIVVGLRDLVQEDRREEGAEDRHQVDKQAGLAGTDLADRPVVKDVAEETGEQSGIGNACQRACVEPDRPPLHDFPGVSRGQREQADNGEGGEHQHRMDAAGAPMQADGIERPGEYRHEHPQIPHIQRQPDQRGQLAMGDDGRHAGQREQDAEPFDTVQLLVQKGPGQRDGDDRDEGVEQHGVGRRRVLQGDVRQRVVAADPEQAEEDNGFPSALEQRPLAAQVGQRQRQRERQRDGPAPEGQRKRRHVAADGAAYHHIAGPEERGQDEQQVRVFEAWEHAAEVGRKNALCIRKGFKQLTVSAHALSDTCGWRVAISFTALLKAIRNRTARKRTVEIGRN